MPSIVLTLGQDGKLCGVSREDQIQFGRWCARAKAMQPGDTMTFSYDVARSQKLHARYFVAINEIWDTQETFRTANDLREWAERGAGHVETFAVAGVPCSRVKSIAYDQLDDDEFFLLFSQVKAYLLSQEALRKLWPHAPLADAYEAVKNLLEKSL